MTIPQAIKKAIKGGYIRRAYDSHYDAIFLDPLFWQALGKVMGWQPAVFLKTKYSDESSFQNWLGMWHRFIDHLAEGKSIESFFEQL